MSSSASQTKAEVVKQSVLDAKMEQHQFSIPLPENISNILSVNANIAVTNFEVLVGQVNFEGEACLNIVYSLEDGTISNYKNCEKISGKFEDLGLDPNTLIKILPNIIDMEIEKDENSNSIKINLSLEYQINMVKNQEVAIYKNEDESTFVKESEIEISKHVCRNCTNFSQKTIFDTKLPVKQILNIVSTAIINKSDALDGMVVFEGEIITKVLYTSEDDRPVIVSLMNKENFREEVGDTKATKTSMVEAFIRVVNKDIEETINKEGKTIEVNIPVKLCYDLFETVPVTITVDAYSTKNEINLTTEAFLSNQVSGYEIVENKIDGNISLDEKALRIDKVIAVDGAFLTTISQKYNDGELQLQGLIHLNVIFLNDEKETINSISIEIPFSFKENVGDGELDIKTESNIIEIDAVVKRGRDIYVDGKIKTAIWKNREVKNAVVSAIGNGEELPEREGAIEIYFANPGETFWDIAKDLKISEQTLKMQNPQVIEPFVNAEKIVYFDQRTIPEV